MSRSGVEHEHEDEDDEGVEYEEAGENDEQPDARPRLRSTELMFSAPGRIALGVLGVLLFLGGVAVVSKYAFQEDPKVAGAKKSVSDSAKPAQKETAKSDAAKATGKSGSILPASATQEEPAETAPEPGEFFRPPPDGNDRYSDYYEHVADSETAPADHVPAADPLVGADAAATSAPPANLPEFERDLPAVTPIVATAPQPIREPPSAAPATRRYQARAGESLFDIARYELGSAARWIEIYDLNLASLGDELESLPAGTQLLIPAQ